MSVRVILVDDHEIFLEGMSALLAQQPEIEIVAQVKSGLEAIEATRAHAPDVVLMDLSMPEMNGIEATRQIRGSHPDVRVLVLSMHAEERFVSGALSAGAAGYLVKDCSVREAMRAIRTVVDGQCYLSPSIAGSVLQDYRSRLGGSANAPSLFPLTDREREVLRLIAEGFETEGIATRLDESAETIQAHRALIMKKLDIHSTAGLTKYALRQGLTTVEHTGGG